MSDETEKIRIDICHHMARAFFMCAWQELSEYPDCHLQQTKIMEAMPTEIDPAAVLAAESLATSMEHANNNQALAEVLAEAITTPAEYKDRECNAEYFGHYAAMQSMGYGTGLHMITAADIAVPYQSFDRQHLERNYADILAQATT